MTRSFCAVIVLMEVMCLAPYTSDANDNDAYADDADDAINANNANSADDVDNADEAD